MILSTEIPGMSQFKLIRERFLADSRRYFFASDTMTQQRRFTRSQNIPTTCGFDQPRPCLMSTAA